MDPGDRFPNDQWAVKSDEDGSPAENWRLVVGPMALLHLVFRSSIRADPLTVGRACVRRATS